MANVASTELTDLQRRNLAAIRIKRAQMRNQFGNNIQIVDTDEEVLRATGPMAIPASAIMTDKQIVIKMDNIIEHLDGSQELVSEKNNQPLASNLEDVLSSLENTANIMEEQLRGASKPRAKKATDFVIPEGYKLVRIDEEETAAPAVTGFNDIGIAVPKESKLSDKEALDELLA